jgi:Arc/MetJ family transcription regulator
VTVPLRPTDDGWLEWTDAPAGTDVFVQVDQAPDGRYRLVGLTMTGHLSAERLRSLPVGRIEAAANALLHGDSPGGGRSRARIADSLRSNAVQGYPDAFYDAVAAAYRGLVGNSSRPIAELAEANDVPLTTAQRWVKEARRRGKLPPGRPGKSG